MTITPLQGERESSVPLTFGGYATSGDVDDDRNNSLHRPSSFKVKKREKYESAMVRDSTTETLA